MRTTPLLRLLVGTGVAAALPLLVVGCGADRTAGPESASSDPSPSQSPSQSPARGPLVDPDPDADWATRDFPRTADGLTYGSDAKASRKSEAPELIAVVATNGRGGFVPRSALWDDGVRTLEDARRYEQRISNGWRPPPVEVRDLDGRRVGWFRLSMGDSGG